MTINFRVFLVVLAVVLVAMAPLLAWAKVAFPPQLEDACAAEGGCVWVSKKWLVERIDQAVDAGREIGVAETAVKCGRIL